MVHRHIRWGAVVAASACLLALTSCSASENDAPSSVESRSNAEPAAQSPRGVTVFDGPVYHSIEDALTIDGEAVKEAHMVFGHISKKVGDYVQTVDGIDSGWAFYELQVDDPLDSKLMSSVVLLAPASDAVSSGAIDIRPGSSGLFIIASPDAPGQSNSLDPKFGHLYYARALLEIQPDGRYADSGTNDIAPLTRTEIVSLSRSIAQASG